jgi:outer membrane protein assembly factor BamB
LLLGFLALCGMGRLPAATLERIISHENPDFHGALNAPRLVVGRDGLVYLCAQGNNPGGPYSYVLRLTRDGKEKWGGLITAGHNATANKDGIVAAAVFYGHKVSLYDRTFRSLGAVDDFLQAGGSLAPPHVEAGAGGDFYGLDQCRDQVVRLSAAAKVLKVFSIPRKPKENHTLWDFRVCEKVKAFYVYAQAAPAPRLFCVGFDGKERWSYKGGVSAHADAIGYVAAFDVDDAGVLYVLAGGSEVQKLSPAGKPLGKLTLRMGKAKPGPNEPGFSSLRVFGNDLLLGRPVATELFQRYDLRSGALRQVVQTDHERLRVTFDGEVWTAGKAVPLRVHLTAGTRTLAPRWRVWARPLAGLDYREFPLRGESVRVPADCAGLYLVKVTPEVLPWQRYGAATSYLVRTVVEIRQPGTKGSATVLTPDNRTHFGRGEAVPFTVVVRGLGDDELPLTVELADGKHTLARGRAKVKRGALAVAFQIPATLTAGLRPGRYRLAVSAKGLTCTGQPLVIGPGKAAAPFHFLHYADYTQTFPPADVWDAPDRAAAHAARLRKLGVNLLVDRLGYGPYLETLEWDRGSKAELDALAKRLAARPGAVAPGKAAMAAPLLQTQAAYSAAGIEQMAILMSMDAGLPLGTGFDRRTPQEFERDITRVTRALSPYPSFRGWSWAANWWVWEKRGAKAAKTPQEQAAYEKALKRAEQTGAWEPVLDKVSGYRLNYAVEAQALFNAVLKKVAPGKVTAVAGPYRNVESYPPVSFRNVDEVDLHYQAEQIQPPDTAPHNVDFQKRPGKRAWGHPELFNEAGTGDQMVPALFQMVMRGADGVGSSGLLPNWGPQLDDPRSSYHGSTSAFRALGGLLRQYGPWLTTLHNHDRVAIVVSGRMARIDDWKGIGGKYFTRLFEVYQSCLRAHYPASFVFTEDLTPRSLARYKALLVVGQTVKMEPELATALARAKSAGTAVFHDDTCRKELLREFTPLGVAFDKVENDPSVWQDDSAYLRFPAYYRKNLPALKKALGRVLRPAAEVDFGGVGRPAPSASEVLLSERAAEDGRCLFVVNNTTPDLDPGQMWRVTLFMASRVPVQAPVRIIGDAAAVYDVFAGKRVRPEKGVVQADCRTLPARIFAVLPAAIARIELRGPKAVKAGQRFAWSAVVQDETGKPIRASIPVRLRLLDGDGQVLEERYTAAGSRGAAGTMRAVLNATPGVQTLEATELLGGKTARLRLAVAAPTGPASLAAKDTSATDSPVAPAATKGTSQGTKGAFIAAENAFGPHVRDMVLTEDGSLAVMNAMNWDHNLYAVDVATGKVRWRQRAGHYFAFAPQALKRGVAVQGFDFRSAEGYHLYLAGSDGKLQRRFALYGFPRRLPHRFIPGAFLMDRINQFAVPADGRWVASAGDLGLAVWARDGKRLWSQDWWKTGRHTATLAALDTDTLFVAEGMKVAAYAARTGKRLWQLTLAATGEVRQLEVSRDGKTCALAATTEGGRVYVLREGKLRTTISGALTVGRSAIGGSPAAAGFAECNAVALSADGSLVAVTGANLLRLYSLADGLRWVLPGDDVLHFPRFAPDGKRLAVSSELGTVYVVDQRGKVLLNRDLGTIAVPAWLPGGDLLLATWMGTVCRLDTQYAERWRTRLRPAALDMRGQLLAGDGTPTSRIAFAGNAEATPAPLTPNLLGPKSAFIKLVWQHRTGEVNNAVLFAHDSAALMDGKPDAPAAPWISWPQMNWYAEGDPFTYLWIDTYRTRLRVTGITLVEDPAHPESWLRDATLEYWDAAREQWVFVQPLLSNAAIHTHKLAKPIEAARFRIVLPTMLCGNLRLGEIVLHGKKLGSSHPDVTARRPVAVLFDEGNDLVGYLHGATMTFKGAYSGGRCLTLGAGGGDAYSFAPWLEGAKVFGHTLPNWDFEIAEKPKPGQYRYLQFAWRALAPGTKGIALRVDNGTHDVVTFLAGERPPGEAVANPRKVADKPPGEWTVVRIDLWQVFQKPVRIRGLRLASTGGPAAFDQILLGRALKDLPAARKSSRGVGTISPPWDFGRAEWRTQLPPAVCAWMAHASEACNPLGVAPRPRKNYSRPPDTSAPVHRLPGGVAGYAREDQRFGPIHSSTCFPFPRWDTSTHR